MAKELSVTPNGKVIWRDLAERDTLTNNFKIRIAVDPNDDLISNLTEMIDKAIAEKWGSADKVPKYFVHPLRDGNTCKSSDDEVHWYTKDKLVCQFVTQFDSIFRKFYNEEAKSVTNEDLNLDSDASSDEIRKGFQEYIYDGCIVKIQFSYYAYDNKNMKRAGVRLMLEGVQFIEDGDRISTGGGNPFESVVQGADKGHPFD